jgi:hypothetical protein
MGKIMIDDRYLVSATVVLIIVSVAFSWLVAFGPLYETMAYPGDAQPRAMLDYSPVDCINYVFYVNGKTVPMSDGVIARECAGE